CFLLCVMDVIRICTAPFGVSFGASNTHSPNGGFFYNSRNSIKFIKNIIPRWMAF
ncbi:mCG1046256, partial [Mus musculus]